MAFYLANPHYPKLLGPLGFSDADFASGGSDRLVDAIVAWGSVDQIRERVEGHFAAGADQVVLNLQTRDTAIPYVEELRRLAVLTAG